jgi:L-asparaginase II
VQKLVRACIEEAIDTPLTTKACGIDGCSLPTWAAPLTAFAKGFARMATGEGLEDDLVKAAHRIFAAITAHPLLIRGNGSLDSEAIAVFKGRLILKIGAEGVFCGALLDKGLGFALKLDDGSMAAAECAIANLLLAVAEPNAAETAVLHKWAAKTNTNCRDREVGAMRGTAGAFPKAN